MKVHNQFTGTWDLLQWTAKPAEGELFYPFGRDAVGQIVYDASHRVMVSIMKKERQHFASNDFLHGSMEEVLSAYYGFVAYCGTYSIDQAERQVIHHIRISSFPNWVGQDQVRYYNFQDDLLTLRSPTIGSAQHELLWRKTS